MKQFFLSYYYSEEIRLDRSCDLSVCLYEKRKKIKMEFFLKTLQICLLSLLQQISFFVLSMSFWWLSEGGILLQKRRSLSYLSVNQFTSCILPYLLEVVGCTGLSTQYRPISDWVECGFWSGSALFVTCIAVLDTLRGSKIYLFTLHQVP